jgi:hypothetical protein
MVQTIIDLITRNGRERNIPSQKRKRDAGTGFTQLSQI